MELLQLQYFCSAAELENFTAAAKRHFIPQSAVSITVRRLEEELGVRLFDRAGNRVTLNEDGKRFYAHARQCVDAFRSARECVQAAGEQPQGEVRLLVLEERRTVAELVTRFHALYPAVSFTVCHDLFGQETAGFHYDIRVTAAGQEEAGSLSTPILRERLALAVSQVHRLATRDQVAVAELADEPFVLMPKGNSIRRMTDTLCKKNGFSPRVGVECDDPFCIRRYIRAGMGVSLVPYYSWDGQFDERVRLIPLADAGIERVTVLECRRARADVPAVQMFYRFCIDNVQSLRK